VTARYSSHSVTGSHAPETIRSEPGSPNPGQRKILIFSFPHAGGQANSHRPLLNEFGAEFGVHLMELPGHGSLHRQPLAQDMATLVQTLTERTERLLEAGADYILHGHSMGAVLAYEIGCALLDRGVGPSALVIGGRDAPTAQGATQRHLHSLPDPELIRYLTSLGGLSPTLLEHPDALAFYLPVLRGDLRVLDTYRPVTRPPLTCPVTVLAGLDDPLVTDEGLHEWCRLTTGHVNVRRIAGGHFCLNSPDYMGEVAAVTRSVSSTSDLIAG